MNLLNKNAGIRSFWCLPNNATILQVRAVIVNELSKKPETWNQNFALLATRALMDTFPCKKS